MSAQPPRRAPRAPRPRRSAWIVGVVALLALAYISLNALRTEGPGSTGPAPGERLAPFAAPLVASSLEGDANVATRPGQGEAGAVPACAVDDPRALNICALAREAPVTLAFVAAGAERCTRELDVMQRLARDHPRVRFAAVAIKGSREELRALVRERGWMFPVAHDRDGAVANLYGIAVCPTVVLARRGGEVMETMLGEEAATPGALAVRLRRLERGWVGTPARRGPEAGGRGEESAG